MQMYEGRGNNPFRPWIADVAFLIGLQVPGGGRLIVLGVSTFGILRGEAG
jgi:hypothetical protein